MCKICYIPRLSFDNMPIPAFGSGYRSKYWQNGTTLTVAIDTKDKAEINFIMTGLSRWSESGHIYFMHSNDWETADIRIGLDPRAGSYSNLGTDISLVHKARNTMNLGWLREDMDNGLYGTVSHEGGHTIGLGHEHRRLKLKRDAVLQRYSGPPNNWTTAMIESNILNAFDREQMDLSEQVDYISNMMYAIDGDLTEDGIGTKQNEDLSLGDHEFVAKVYTKPEILKPADGQEVTAFIQQLIYKRARLYGFDSAQLSLICERLNLRADGIKYQKRQRIAQRLKIK